MPRAAAMHHGVRLSAPLKTVHYAFTGPISTAQNEPTPAECLFDQFLVAINYCGYMGIFEHGYIMHAVANCENRSMVRIDEGPDAIDFAFSDGIGCVEIGGDYAALELVSQRNQFC